MNRTTLRRDGLPAEPPNDALLRLITEPARDGVVIIDDQGQLLEANAAAARMLGVDPTDLAGKRLSELTRALPKSFVEPWGAALSTERADDEPLVHRADGSIVELRGLGSAGPGRHLVFLHDVTAQRRSDRRRAIHLMVAKVLLECATLSEALPKLLEVIGEKAGWPIACLWQVDRDAGVLRWAGGWHASSVPDEAASEEGRVVELMRNEGPVGRVWASGEASWCEDLLQDPGYGGRGAVVHDGLRATFAVPLRLAGEVVGVLEFFSHEVQRRDDNLLQTLGSLDVLLGQFIERARLFEGEQKLRKQYQRVAARISALQRVTGALSEAATPADVARVVVREGAGALAADFGALALVDHDEFEVIDTMALDAELELPRVTRFSRTTPGPFEQAVRSREAVFAESRDELEARFPEAPRVMKAPVEAMAAIPLVAHGTALGAFGLAFRRARRFASDDRALMCTLARQCALALERARLDEAERTRLETARAGAEAATRAKDEFLAVLSHELRTPLQSILGWSQLLLHGKPSEATVQRAIDTIDRNARAQAKLIEDLLDVSRIVAGQVRLERRNTSLARVVEAAALAMKLTSETKGVELKTTVRDHSAWISGDSERLAQVFSNLLSNSIKFTPRGGRIEVTLEERDGKASVVVSDTGCGISGDLLPRIFERFSQGDSSSRRVHRGLGLGLTIVRHLIELHDGTVRAESPGEGLGARFTVELPLANDRKVEAGDEEHAARLIPIGALTGIRVLVVDDDPDTCELITSVVHEAGAVVRAASSARGALAALDDFAPHVLISDIGMPEADGYALIREVRARESARGGHVFAIALTAYASHGDREAAISAGYQAHVAKPVKPDDLTRIITLSSVRGGQEP